MTLPNFFLSANANISQYHAATHVFVHHNKAGGDSIKRELQKSARSQRHVTLLEVLGDSPGFNVCNFSPAAVVRDPSGCKSPYLPRGVRGMLISGDYSFGVCDTPVIAATGHDCVHFTMLREPRARVASSYLYCRQSNGVWDQLCNSHVLLASNASFEAWVRHQGNYLTRQLSFDIGGALSLQEARTAYERVRAGGEARFSDRDVRGPLGFHPNQLWLQEHERGRPPAAAARKLASSLPLLFGVIGLLERWAESLALFKAGLGIDLAPYSSVISRHRPAPGHREAEAALVRRFESEPALAKEIQGDEEIYHAAKVIFERQMQSLRASGAARPAAS